MKNAELRKDTAERIMQYYNSDLFEGTKEWDTVGEHITEFLENHDNQHDTEIKALIDEIDHTVNCATNASEVADEFRAMGCTCGRDKFVKQFKEKL